MPLYEYQCEACRQRFEVIRRFSDPELEACSLCGKGPVRRLLSSPAIQFKGSGWYITDYSQKGKTGSESSGTESGDGSKPAAGEASGSAKSDAKSDTATPPAKPASAE
jgi:putative FmdB family regulatory protein